MRIALLETSIVAVAFDWRLTTRQNWNGLDRVRTGNELGEIEITTPFASLQGEIPNHRRQRETR